MSADLAILQALESALSDAAARLPVAYQNIAFFPTPDLLHVECYVLPAKTQNPTMGDGFYRQSGIFQVTVVGFAGEGSTPTLLVAGEIADLFFRGRTLIDTEGLRLFIDETPTVGRGMTEAPRYRVPVSISYIADVMPA